MSTFFTFFRHQITSVRTRLLAGLVLTILALYLALRDVDLRSIWDTLWQADRWLVLLALLAILLNVLSKAVRWKVLMGKEGQNVSTLKTLEALLVGQMLNALAPMRIGDVGRAYIIGQSGLGRSFALGTVVLEKAVDLLSFSLLFFCSCSGYRCPGGRRAGSTRLPGLLSGLL